MTDQQSWTEQWFKAQQQFVDTWSEMAKQGNEAAKTNQADLWAESFKLWNKGMQQGSQPDLNSLMGKTMEISKSMFGMAEQLGQYLASEKDPICKTGCRFARSIRRKKIRRGGRVFSFGAAMENPSRIRLR